MPGGHLPDCAPPKLHPLSRIYYYIDFASANNGILRLSLICIIRTYKIFEGDNK